MKLPIQIDDDLKELIPKFLQNRKKDISDIECALTRGDFATITLIGHRIRGSAGGYGFPELSDLGKELEESAKATDLVSTSSCLDRMKHHLQELENILADFLPS